MDKAFLIVVLAFLLTSPYLTSVAFSLSAEATLPILNVDTDLSYATIQEAINAEATLEGHTIRVASGTYFENVAVSKSVSLVGENKLYTIIDGRASGSVVHIMADRVSMSGFTVRNSSYGYSGIYVDHSSDDNISQNVIENNYNGIYIHGSTDSSVIGNDVSGNEYGIRLYSSVNNTISGNDASNNINGIHLDLSGNNTLIDNNVWANMGNGIYLYGSDNNTFSGNSAHSNYGRGIRLQYSSNNALLDNVVSSNRYGISLYGSAKNVLRGNNVSFNNESGILFQSFSDLNLITDNVVINNLNGVWLIDSGGSAVLGNNVSSSSEYGVRLWNSSRNKLFHNNFMGNLVKNVEQPTNTSILNLWDDGVEGNFWDDYVAAANVNGIGDKPYIIDEYALGVYAQDSYPLIGQFFQFSISVENGSYTTTVVSNFAVTGFGYDRGSDNKTNTMSFNVSAPATQGTGFSRVCIPHVLITPPYVVMVGQTRPLSYSVVRTNGTHTWIYVTYAHSARGLAVETVLPVLPQEAPIWFQWWFWGMFGLALIGAVLAYFAVKYRRKVAEQTKLLQAYSPFVIAEELFKADIERRGLKIKEFEKKYGVKIQPRSNLEDVIRSLETKEKEEKKG